MEDMYEIDYVFDSDYVVEEKFEKYDGREFTYELGIDEVKYFFAEDYIKRLQLDADEYDIVNLLDEMEYNGEFDWVKVLKKDYENIKEHYKREAMEWYAEQHDEDLADEYMRTDMFD